MSSAAECPDIDEVVFFLRALRVFIMTLPLSVDPPASRHRYSWSSTWRYHVSEANTYACTHTHTHTQTHTHTHTQRQTDRQTNRHMHTHIYAYTHTHTHMHKERERRLQLKDDVRKERNLHVFTNYPPKPEPHSLEDIFLWNLMVDVRGWNSIGQIVKEVA